jgi:hypothetical protein
LADKKCVSVYYILSNSNEPALLKPIYFKVKLSSMHVQNLSIILKYRLIMLRNSFQTVHYLTFPVLSQMLCNFS